MADREAEQAVVRVYEDWRKAFMNVDARAMKALFDQEYDGLVYQAEELTDPLYDWPSIAKYWDAAHTVLERVNEWTELSRKVAITGDAAFVYAKTMTRLKIVGVQNELAGELRSTLGLHRRNGRWLMIHYHESRALDLEAILRGG
ncbi:MAG: nuclear transport factor 2 family protein [Candidatus Binatia bacterium]